MSERPANAVRRLVRLQVLSDRGPALGYEVGLRPESVFGSRAAHKVVSIAPGMSPAKVESWLVEFEDGGCVWIPAAIAAAEYTPAAE